MSHVIFTFGDGNLFYIHCGGKKSLNTVAVPTGSSEHTTHHSLNFSGDAKLNYGHFTGKIWM
jgi:hypothetical protein